MITTTSSATSAADSTSTVPRFFALPNLSSQEVSRVDPVASDEKPRKDTKASHTAYATSPDTKDCFLSFYQGQLEGVRVSNSNPAIFLHGLLADYEAPLTQEQRLRCVDKCKVKPTFVSESYSRGTHAFWLFEAPVPLLDASNTHEFLAIAKRELAIDRAFEQFDETAFFNTAQYFHRGWKWTPTGAAPIPMERLMLWLSRSWKKYDWASQGVEMPLSRVKEEVDKRYPSRWSGDFREGSRGVRFWDPTADNPTAAVVTPSGMICYTGSTSFMSWNAIFGDNFCESYESETEGAALRDCYCVNDKFWHRQKCVSDTVKRPRWRCYNRTNAESLLAEKYNLRRRRKPGEDASQLERVISTVISMKTLDGVVPILFSDEETATINGRTYLNISVVEAMQPERTKGKHWGDGFPWLAEFLENLLGDSDKRQLTAFMSWLAYAYQGALKHKPRRGQAVFIAGGAGTGKSFLSECILTPLFGGSFDATDFLCGRTRFNRELFSCGLWTINDATPLKDTSSHEHYSAMVKKLVANSTFAFEGKFIESEKIPWLGRVVVTCNTDAESLRILPVVDINNSDKLMFFRSTDKELEEKDPESKVAAELPAFANYLANYEIPKECQGGARFGVAGYMHPDLKSAAEEQGASGTFAEILDTFLRGYFMEPDVNELRGTASEIFSLMSNDEAVRPLVDRWLNPISVGTRMGQLRARGKYPLEQNGRTWRITKADFIKYREGGPQQ